MKYRKGYKYQLAEAFLGQTIIYHQDIRTGFIHLMEDGRVWIAGGYAWDGPSGPTVDTDNFLIGSLVHDVLYQLIRMEELPVTCRKFADQTLYNLCVEAGMSRLRAKYTYWAVRKFGGDSAVPGDVKEVFEV